LDDDKFSTFVLCKFISLTNASSATAAFRDSKKSQEAKLEYLNLVLASFMEDEKARFTVRDINGTRSNIAVFVVDDLRVVTPNRVGDYSSLSVSKHFDFLSDLETNVVNSLTQSSSQELSTTPLTQDLQAPVTPSTRSKNFRAIEEWRPAFEEADDAEAAVDEEQGAELVDMLNLERRETVRMVGEKDIAVVSATRCCDYIMCLSWRH
jgi:hypothetical protein